MKILKETAETIILTELSLSGYTEPETDLSKLSLSFEVELLYRRGSIVEVCKLLHEYASKMKSDHPVKADFDYHRSNLLQVVIMEDIVEKELRVARQRAYDLEFEVLRLKTELANRGEGEKEIVMNNKELRDMQIEIDTLRKKNEELIKML